MNNVKTNTKGWNSRIQRQLLQLAGWTGAWVLTMALATFGPEFFWDLNVLTIVVVGINLAFGVGMIVANIHYLDALDEMMQKIQLQAMGLALGMGAVGGLSYELLDNTNLIASDAEISHLVMGIAITYLAAIFINHRRYK